MKFNKQVTSSRRKQRKAHFSASSAGRRQRMSSTLSHDLRAKHGVRSLPIRKDDEVFVLRGEHKGRDGKVVQVYRKKYCIHIEKLTIDKANGATVNIPVDASNVQITKLRLDRARKKLIERKAAGRAKHSSKLSGSKFSESTVSNMSQVD